ncbi:MAG: hypothetical protein U9O20_02790 [Patescibacteria group bacterium]|nr:hypothetical protein [Patescibacteria group bacterium]
MKRQNKTKFRNRKPSEWKTRCFRGVVRAKKSLIRSIHRKKRGGLRDREFLSVFNYNLQSPEDGFSFGRFIKNYKYREDLLGKDYKMSLFWDKFSTKLGKIARKMLKIIGLFSYRLVVVGVLLALVYLSTPGTLGAPQSTTITTQTEWESGEVSGISTTSENDALQLSPDGTWTARSWAPAPDTISFGSTSILVGNYLYVARGYSDDDMYVYNIELNEWEEDLELP